MLCVVEADLPKACLSEKEDDNCKYRSVCTTYQSAFNDYSISFDRWLGMVMERRHPDCPFKRRLDEPEDSVL